MRIRGRAWIVTTVTGVAWLAIARPWTIRPIAEEPRGPFDARAYVTKIWDARVIPDIRAHAIPFGTFQSQHMTSATAVSFEGVATDVNTSSRVGTASIDMAPADGRADALLMIGPVIRGTALRDALAFIQFTDFTNQIQFAAVASTLNERVLTTTLKNITPPALAGHRVAVVGVAWKDSTAADALPFVVPVQLSLGDRP